MIKKISIFLSCISLSLFANEATSESDVMEETKAKEGISEDILFKKEEPIANGTSFVKYKQLFGGAILVQGDTRFSYSIREIKDGDVSLLGKKQDRAQDQLKGEFNFYLNYVALRYYGRLRLKFSNDLGSMGGRVNSISLEKAYIGYQLLQNGFTTLGIEVGRRPLLEMLESNVQFSSKMDGASLFLGTQFPKLFEFDFRGIVTVVDEVTAQFGYIGQVSFYNIYDYGLGFKYAFTDWEKKGLTRVFNGNGDPTKIYEKNNPRYQFKISQFTINYFTKEKILGKKIRLYGAFLINHAAKKRELTNNKKENLACYGGFTYGKAAFEGDFSLDINYQYVEAQSVPDFDASGIGTGNPLSNVFYGPAKNDITGVPLAPNEINATNANGNTNFKGINVKIAYVITPNLQIQAGALFSRRLDGRIGPNRTYKAFGFTTIYSF